MYNPPASVSDPGPSAAPARSKLSKLGAILPRPWWTLLVFVAPTMVAVVTDLFLRGRVIAQMRPIDWFNYVGSTSVACCFWCAVLWALARISLVTAARWRRVGWAAYIAGFLLVVTPVALLSHAGQPLYYSVFHSYMTRDTLRLGLAMKGTAGAWLAEWSWRVVPLSIAVLAGVAVLAWAVRRVAPAVRGSAPLLPIALFLVATITLARDAVETRAHQAASPDTCLLHGIMGLVRDKWIFDKGVARGVTVRQPLPVPPLDPPARPRNVLLIITESVRADVLCSDKSAGCSSRFLDDVIPDRMGLLRMTTQSPSTFSACMMIWSGLGPEADMRACHQAPFLWEVARSIGYDTAYITSQNGRYQDFGAYTTVSGARTYLTGVDLGGMDHAHLGAPDERATARMVEWIRTAREPWFAVLQLSNTHWPYRTAPDLEPYTPHSDAVPDADVTPYWNQYRNSVLLQERTISRLYADLATLPSWDRTVSLFLSDHGEQFREHGRLYHINDMFEEEVRVPAFVVAGPSALTEQERLALRANRDRRAYSQDVHATMLDALGVFEQRSRMPFADRLIGRSLLRKLGVAEPTVLMSTTTGVWQDQDTTYAVMRGEAKLMGDDATPWRCFLLAGDPKERSPKPAAACGPLLDVARKAWPEVPVR
jgi:hypothetical protein